MANKISDETIEYVGILAKLELSGQEKEDAKADMEKMLDYIDTLNELDTDQAEPLVHILPEVNVFREDQVTNGDGRKDSLARSVYRTKDRIAGGRSNGRNLTDVCAGTVKTDPARLRQCKRSSGSLQKTDTEVRVPGTCLCFHG